MLETPVTGRKAVQRWAAMEPEELERELGSRGLADGLPHVRPTLAGLEVMLAAAGASPDDIVATIPPLGAAATVEMIATVALLAGCAAAHLPVLIGAVRALTQPELNALGVLTTTGNAALMAFVNGPVARVAGYSGGANCLGPGSRANASTGRALTLVCRSLGGAREGLADMATMGQPAKYSFCFAENEVESPWPSYSVELGFAEGESTVTVVGVSGVLEVFNGQSSDPSDLLQTMANAMSVPAAVYTPDRQLVGGGHPIVLISPEWAGNFAGAGLSKADVRRQLHERSGWSLTPDQRLAVASKADDIIVLVAGGVGIKQTFVPNWSGGSKAVTVKV